MELYLKPVERLPLNTCVVEESPVAGVDMLWFPRERACWICGGPTCWVELNFQAWTCPVGCVDEAWSWYFEANRQATRKYGPWEKGLDRPPTSE